MVDPSSSSLLASSLPSSLACNEGKRCVYTIYIEGHASGVAIIMRSILRDRDQSEFLLRRRSRRRTGDVVLQHQQQQQQRRCRQLFPPPRRQDGSKINSNCGVAFFAFDDDERMRSGVADVAADEDDEQPVEWQDSDEGAGGASGRRASASLRPKDEQDFYTNPTVLSRLILYHKYEQALNRLQLHPDEAFTWVCSKRRRQQQQQRRRDKDNEFAVGLQRFSSSSSSSLSETNCASAVSSLSSRTRYGNYDDNRYRQFPRPSRRHDRYSGYRRSDSVGGAGSSLAGFSSASSALSSSSTSEVTPSLISAAVAPQDEGKGKNADVYFTIRQLPIHMACSNLLLQESSFESSIDNGSSSTNHRQRSVLQDLIRMLAFTNPSGCADRDHLGRLPLHYAIMGAGMSVHCRSTMPASSAFPETIAILLMAAPTTLYEPDPSSNGKLLPVELNQYYSYNDDATGDGGCDTKGPSSKAPNNGNGEKRSRRNQRLIIHKLLSRGVEFWKLARQEAILRMKHRTVPPYATPPGSGGGTASNNSIDSMSVLASSSIETSMSKPATLDGTRRERQGRRSGSAGSVVEPLAWSQLEQRTIHLERMLVDTLQKNSELGKLLTSLELANKKKNLRVKKEPAESRTAAAVHDVDTNGNLSGSNRGTKRIAALEQENDLLEKQLRSSTGSASTTKISNLASKTSSSDNDPGRGDTQDQSRSVLISDDESEKENDDMAFVLEEAERVSGRRLSDIVVETWRNISVSDNVATAPASSFESPPQDDDSVTMAAFVDLLDEAFRIYGGGNSNDSVSSENA